MKSRLFACVALVGFLLPGVWGFVAPLEGKWQLSTVLATGESAVLIFKTENSKEAPKAEVVYYRTNPLVKNGPPKPEIVDFQVSEKTVSFTVKQGEAKSKFVGQLSKDAKTILGSYGVDPRPQRAVLTATDKETLDAKEAMVRKPAEAYTKAISAQNKGLMLTFQARNEKDAEKKKELLEKSKEAQKEADLLAPGLWREAVKAHEKDPAGYDAALSLLRGSAKNKVTVDEAATLVKTIEDQARPYGPRFERATTFQLAEMLANDKSLAKVGAAVAKKATTLLTEKDSAEVHSQAWGYYKAALINSGDVAGAKEVSARIAKLDEKLDAEYAKNVPPFKPVAYKGRENKDANRVVVMELFTGAQCPPCVAADVAFDALGTAYDHKDLILIQYHLHIPGPDPLTNPASENRMEFYKKVHEGKVRSSTPTTLFNGKPEAGGGGALTASQRKFDQYKGIIDSILEIETLVKLSGKTTRVGSKISTAVEVQGVDPKDELKVRFVVVEEKIKYVGSNKLRFHHHVVRAVVDAKGPVAGNKTSHSAQVDLGQLHQELTDYLDKYSQTRAFSNPSRPLDLQDLKVIALVQNDKTGEIVQALQMEVKDGAN